MLTTPNFIAMSADRRLTVRQGNAVVDQRDLETKLTYLHGQMIVGYTGLATLAADGERTSWWLQSVTEDVMRSQIRNAIRGALQKRWDHDPSLKSVAHSFLGSGFEVDSRTNRLRAYHFTISNATNSRGDFNPHRIKSAFDSTRDWVDNGHSVVATTGEDPLTSDLDEFNESVKSVRRLGGGGMEQLYGAFVLLNRRTAALTSGTVGQQMTFATLPRLALPVEGFRQEMGPASCDYDRVAVSRTFNIASSTLAEVPYFPPALITKGIVMQDAQLVAGGFGEIGPMEKLTLELTSGLRPSGLRADPVL